MSEIYPIAVPKWGIEMVEGTVTGWKKSEGETVAKGDEVLEIESDKIVNVWESPVSGVLRRQLAPEGETMKVGALLGVIASAELSDADIDAFIAGFDGGAGKSATAPGGAAISAPTPAPAAAGAFGDTARRVNPVVRRLAEELGVDLESVTGSGRNGRITAEDVQLAASGAAAGTSNTDATSVDGVEIIPLSATRKTIGRRLSEAKQTIPHFYLSRDYEIDGLMRHREKLNAEGGSRVSLNDLLTWCVARALAREPRVNVNLIADAIHQFKHANVAVAIATDDGLYPATIRHAETLTPQQIAEATAQLAAKAQAGTLAREDISGASFTVSNLGMYGVANFTAIINPPMGAILALGKAVPRVVVHEGRIETATVVNATLSCDHRVIDGAIGARFLAVLAEEIAQLA